MIPNKLRETRKLKNLKLSKNIERLYKEGKCRECVVVVTRMDFAKILGRFTKVKIQYESSTTRKERLSSPNVKSRLKSNENGVVHVQKKAYNGKPEKDLSSKKSKLNDSYCRSPNILKENNRLKKIKADKASVKSKKAIGAIKQYGIIFEKPTNNNKDSKSLITLSELLPHIDNGILPTEEWLVDYFPKTEEPKDDKVYDRIAAELEDLMYSEKSKTKVETILPTENKIDEFPTIMDILNDNISDSKPDDQTSTEFKSNLESSDVEAMLLGKTNDTSSSLEATPMEVDTPEINNLMPNVDQLNTLPAEIAPVMEQSEPKDAIIDNIENPHSPSILDETLQKGIEEHLPPSGLSNNVNEPEEMEKNSVDNSINENKSPNNDSNATCVETSESDTSKEIRKSHLLLPLTGVEEVIFKKSLNGKCFKSVICPKNLKYSVTLEGKPVEFLGAPKFISSLEDLKVLLQIVNETELKNLYVLH